MRSIFLLDEDVWNQQIGLDGIIETTRILFHVVCSASSPVQACFLKMLNKTEHYSLCRDNDSLRLNYSWLLWFVNSSCELKV
jgi:hypothetical protein